MGRHPARVIPLAARVFTSAALLLAISPCVSGATEARVEATSRKRFDLVLLHGLTNKQRWSDAFLSVCAETWGEGRVFLVYTDRDATDRARTATRRVAGHTLIVGGRDLSSAGDESVARQAQHMAEIVARLQAERGLGSRFSIVAHSMGGLVARRYIADHPGVVTGLVTLGTPHHGSPLANEAKWVGFFAHATDAIVDLQPERCAAFNARYPASAARLAEGGRIYTIRGRVDGPSSLAELAVGWTLLHAVDGLESDGLVPDASALLDGAEHLADFAGTDHHDLIRDAAVARRAASVLP
jgi:triacylglycerol lipase